MSDEEVTERVTMVWPKDLKAQVREKVGPRGLTEFTLEAVEIYLKGGTGVLLRELELELNRTKETVQLLADRMVMGGEHSDRLQALMEVEFPEWVDTTGWPSEFARLVKLADIEIPESRVEAPALTKLMGHFGVDGVATVPAEGSDFKTADVTVLKSELQAHVFVHSAEGGGRVCMADDCAKGPDDPVHEKSTSQPELPAEPARETQVVVEEEWVPPAVEKGRGDLFAKIMERTGGVLDPGFSALKTAAEIPRPEPKPQDERCSNCNDTLVDGECWTCN